VILLLLAGCAYYNTLYNAKSRFGEASDMPRDRDGVVSRRAVATYDDVILKCRKMIATWPGSRHVDDALLLMARSYDESDRFEECVGVIDTLEADYPKSELLPKALALKGGALARWEHYDEAVEVLRKWLEKNKPTASVLYDLSTCLMSLDRSDEAVEYLAILEKKFPKSEETMDARIATAEILADKGQYEESLGVYERLNAQRLPEAVRYRVWMGYVEVELELKRYAEALSTVESLQGLLLTVEQQPSVLLKKGDALTGADSVDAAIATYSDVTTRFSRGEYAAEAHYRLGRIYEKMDSLETAKSHFESVPSAYANSSFARESIKEGNNIAQLIRLQQSEGDENPEAKAQRELSLAELQLFQFANTDRAIEAYSKLLDSYPDSEFAPKAAYALGYIYGVVLADSSKAWESYRLLRERYPNSQQAQYAGQFVAALGPVPPGYESALPVGAAVEPDTTRAAVAPPDTTRGAIAAPDTTKRTVAPPDTTKKVVAPPDTTKKVVAPPDTTKKAVAPPDTTPRVSAPADTARGEGE